MQSGEDIKAIFLDGKVSRINPDENEISTDMANKVIVLFDKNQILLEKLMPTLIKGFIDEVRLYSL